jgi:hypothetical protein
MNKEESYILNNALIKLTIDGAYEKGRMDGVAASISVVENYGKTLGDSKKAITIRRVLDDVVSHMRKS